MNEEEVLATSNGTVQVSFDDFHKHSGVDEVFEEHVVLWGWGVIVSYLLAVIFAHIMRFLAKGLLNTSLVLSCESCPAAVLSTMELPVEVFA